MKYPMGMSVEDNVMRAACLRNLFSEMKMTYGTPKQCAACDNVVPKRGLSKWTCCECGNEETCDQKRPFC